MVLRSWRILLLGGGLDHVVGRVYKAGLGRRRRVMGLVDVGVLAHNHSHLAAHVGILNLVRKDHVPSLRILVVVLLDHPLPSSTDV